MRDTVVDGSLILKLILKQQESVHWVCLACVGLTLHSSAMWRVTGAELLEALCASDRPQCAVAKVRETSRKLLKS